MIPDDLLDRLTRQAMFSNDREEVRSRLRRLLETPSNRWRIDWISSLFPGISDADIRLVASQITSDTLESVFDPQRLKTLRSLLLAAPFDAFVVPQADEHQGEYIPSRNQRLAWLTGFTGSAGTAVVARNQAWLFVDGRYIEQAKMEVDGSYIEVRHFQKPPPWIYLAQTLKPATRLGYDPRLHSMTDLERMRQQLSTNTVELVPAHPNPIDTIWEDRPLAPFSPVVPHPVQFCGRPFPDKLAAIVATLKTSNMDATVLSQLDSIAWLYNIRGGDIANTPIAECFTVVLADGLAELFVEKEKLTPDAIRHLGNHVTIREPSEFHNLLLQMGHRRMAVGLDPDNTSMWLNTAITSSGGTVKRLEDPTSAQRARKNSGELSSLREAMVRDGACVVRFIRWFKERPAEALPDELELSDAITAFRAADPLFRGPSFPSIVGVGPNGAIVHYRPKPETNRKPEPGSLVLVDSGGQFQDGTTDVTRTLIHGEPTPRQRQIYTAVLKCHIALAVAIFPKGTTGAQLDAIARAPLWRIKMNYDHGTGHGIGAFLGVHEGPIKIAPGANAVLEPGMLLSNEPGAYIPTEFGIRLENSIVVVEATQGDVGSHFLRFDTISLAPFERALIDASLLSPEERAWVDDYHARVLSLVGPKLEKDDEGWLQAATRPL